MFCAAFCAAAPSNVSFVEYDTRMLLAAARKCDRNAIEALLDDGGSVNQREIDEARPRKDGATPLHVVVQQSNSELVELLLARGADTTLVDANGCTALHHAAVLEDAEIARMLLASKADATSLDKAGENPLHYAARSGRLQQCQSLLELSLSSNMLDVQSKGKGDTPLILAVCWGFSEVAHLLKEAGADTTKTTRNGWNAERWAGWAAKRTRVKRARHTLEDDAK